MPEISETRLPGVGVRHDFETEAGERVAVLVHRTGRREIAVYAKDDPDRCTTLLHLNDSESRTMGELLGVSPVTEAVSAVQRLVEGLAIDWIALPATSSMIGSTIAEGAFRTRTGASIVAVLRGDATIPAPGPEHRFETGDVTVAVGTPEGLATLRALLES